MRRLRAAGALCARARCRGSADLEDGSITLLTIGMLTIALALVLGLAAASQVHLARKHLYDAADALAVSAADDLDDGSYYGRPAGSNAQVTLTDAGVAAAVTRAAADDPGALHGLQDVMVVAAGTPDGRTARVALRVTVRPSALTWLTAGLSHGVTVTATSEARAD